MYHASQPCHRTPASASSAQAAPLTLGIQKTWELGMANSSQHGVAITRGRVGHLHKQEHTQTQLRTGMACRYRNSRKCSTGIPTDKGKADSHMANHPTRTALNVISTDQMSTSLKRLSTGAHRRLDWQEIKATGATCTCVFCIDLRNSPRSTCWHADSDHRKPNCPCNAHDCRLPIIKRADGFRQAGNIAGNDIWDLEVGNQEFMEDEPTELDWS